MDERFHATDSPIGEESTHGREPRVVGFGGGAKLGQVNVEYNDFPALTVRES